MLLVKLAGLLGGCVSPSAGLPLCLGGEDGSAGLRRSLGGNVGTAEVEGAPNKPEGETKQAVPQSPLFLER